jgi:hypothetical protein
MKVIYKKNGYDARIDRNKVVVVSREASGARGSSHVGEKHASQDWREVRLMGCPDNVRQEIIDAWKAEEN